MTETMRGWVLSTPGPVEHLEPTELPLPRPGPGWVRIRVRAFGMNRSELHTRLGLAEGVVLPRVLGIEAVGTVDLAPDSDLAVGQQVATLMGGLGRQIDGGYAEYTVVRREDVVPFDSALPWEVLGAVPETLQTAYGSLTTGLALAAGQTLLVRGGTSSVGLAAATVARDVGATVLTTTRQRDRVDALRAHGADHVIVDDGDVAAQVHRLLGGGVDAALELVGTPTLPDTLRATRVQGTVCFTGMLSNQWTVPDFYPIEYLPTGVRLTAYGGGSSDLPADVLQRYLDRIADGSASLGPLLVHGFEDVREAHLDLELNRGFGKHVVLTDPV